MTKKRKRRAKSSPAPAASSQAAARLSAEELIVGAVFLGKVTDYYSRVGVITLTLEAPLAVGDTIRVKGHTTDITQKVESLQLERQSVQSAATGDAVGIKIADKARAGDAVYKC
jgi:putative protease